MPVDRFVAREHADWLALVEVSGTFLSLPVLMEAFAAGLDKKADARESELRRRLRLAYDEWDDNQKGHAPDPAIHKQWLRFVLEEVLEMRADALLEAEQLPPELVYEAKEYGETLLPDVVIRSPFEQKPRLLVQLYPAGQSLEKALPGRRWKASPALRMMELLRNTESQGTRLGLVTNGRAWMLVDAPKDETTGFYTWDSELWLEEPLALRSFYTLLGMQRFFNVAQDQTLEALLTKSASRQQEVTNQLGEQVRRAVEMVVQTLDRLDKDSQRTLLHAISETQLYEAALTVMMRLVFLLSAEERDLLLLGTPLYDQHYAVSTLQKRLREQADQQGEEVLSLRHDAWSRLLATFRLVYEGAEYVDLRLPAYGGHLFDPDRYPFLEGRQPGTDWRETLAQPLAIDNRTVLHLLEALQYLQVRLPGGGTEPRRLSFRGLDIEQIGHVYEGLLDHTARRADTTILGLLGNSENEPEATLEELEAQATKGAQALLAFVRERANRSENSLSKALGQPVEKPEERSRLMGACDNRQELFNRVLPFSGLLRRDTFGNFVLVTSGSIYVTSGSDRRSTGTHYTPRSLTEPLVQHALDPLVYIGPAEGLPREEWQLRSAAEILDLKICDFAMGSGAFLVQTCRYLSAKLVEAWDNIERASLVRAHEQNGASNEQDNDSAQTPTQRLPRLVLTAQPAQVRPSAEPLPRDNEERLATARRIVAERCLYGVDKNPMAVEMAKLSLWLITLAKNKPFTFLDSNLRCGDSLLGVNLQQLKTLALDEKDVRQMSFMEQAMERAIALAMSKRREISMRLEHSAADADEKARKLAEAEQATELLKLGGDLLIAITLADPKRRANLRGTLLYDYELLIAAAEDARVHPRPEQFQRELEQNIANLRAEVQTLLNGRAPFHWPLEFPEVFAEGGDEAGFAAIMGNPPFMGGSKITGIFGTDYREYLVEYLANSKRGNADLCTYFFLKITKLIKKTGMSALLATNTIAQGDTREIGLDQIVSFGWSIPRAISSRPWIGEASLEIAYLWLRYGQWKGQYILDDIRVEGITSFLKVTGKALGKPYSLMSNAGKSFMGPYVLGMGFVVDAEEAQRLLTRDPRNKDVLFPYLNGKDFTSRPDQSPSRWVINFFDWSLEKAEMYPDCIRIVRDKVKHERDLQPVKNLREKWWIYKRPTLALYSAIAKKRRVLVIPFIAKYMLCSWLPADIIYAHPLIVVADESNAYFALVQCTFHNDWVRQQGATLRNDQLYAPVDCFETFPFPIKTDRLEVIGERYYTHRQFIMLTRQEGLTDTYNRFHNPDEQAVDIVQLRELHREMDEAVARAYGWEDLRLEQGFHETKQGLRYTISETARREVLDRLLLLNHERHAQEVAAGLVDENGKPLKGKPRGKKSEVSKGRVVEAAPVREMEDGLEQGNLF